MKFNFAMTLMLGAIAASSFSASSMAAQSTRSISLSASISSASNAFSVDALSAWPSTALVISWNSSSKSFTNPTNIGFKVKSTQDVTASLSSTAKLVDGSKEIPIKVGIVCSDTTKCASVSELNLTGQKIYDKSKATTGQYVNYELSVAAQTSNMKDSAGAVISATSPNTPEPAAGNYTGTVDLVFESAI